VIFFEISNAAKTLVFAAFLRVAAAESGWIPVEMAASGGKRDEKLEEGKRLTGCMGAIRRPEELNHEGCS
jgi:hypothetical protein